MMLVDQGAVKAQVFAERPLIEVLLVRLGCELRVAESVGEACLRTDVVRNARVCCLIEGVELHLTPSSRRPSSASYHPATLGAAQHTVADFHLTVNTRQAVPHGDLASLYLRAPL